MNKHLFVTGKINHIKGQKRLDLIPTNDEKLNQRAKDSITEIANVVTFYDISKVKNTDYYFIFKKYGINSNYLDEETVKARVESMLNGNTEIVANSEDFSHRFSDKNTAFIDVNNNIIITKGKENIKEVCIELLMHSYDYINQVWNVETEFEKIAMATDTALIYKTHDLDMTKQIEDTSRKPIKLFYN